MKRFHEDVTDSTAFDCHSLGSSLKRVRISMSPGELRLERDLQNLATHSGWTRRSEFNFQKEIHCSNNHHTICPNDSSQQQQQQTATLSRTQDPLRLVLCLDQKQQQHSTMTRKINVTIQLPRMYPHRPPVVSRIVYQEEESRSSSIDAAHHPTLCPTTHNIPSSSATNSSRIENILVSVSPPGATLLAPQQQSQKLLEKHFQQQKHYGQQRITVVYDQWSPVHRLGDLLDFIIQALTSHNHHLTEPHDEQQQQQQQQNHMRRQENILALHKQESIRRHDDFHRLQNFRNQGDERWGAQNGMEAHDHNHYQDNHNNKMEEDCHPSLSQKRSPKKLNVTFPRNRFDIGYERPYHSYHHHNTTTSDSKSVNNPDPFWNNDNDKHGNNDLIVEGTKRNHHYNNVHLQVQGFQQEQQNYEHHQETTMMFTRQQDHHHDLMET